MRLLVTRAGQRARSCAMVGGRDYRREPVQPGGPGPAAARLLFQAVRLTPPASIPEPHRRAGSGRIDARHDPPRRRARYEMKLGRRSSCERPANYDRELPRLRSPRVEALEESSLNVPTVRAAQQGRPGPRGPDRPPSAGIRVGAASELALAGPGGGRGDPDRAGRPATRRWRFTASGSTPWIMTGR